MKNQHFFIAAITFATLAPALVVHASPIVFTANNISGGVSDIATGGTLVSALNLTNNGTPDETVNGVTFVGAGGDPWSTTVGTGFTAGSFTFASVNTATSAKGSPNAFIASAPVSDPSYNSLLSSAIYNDGSSSTPGGIKLTLNGLTVGDNYTLQLFVNDSRSGGAAQRSELLVGANGGSVTLAENVTQTQNGLGQYALGTFTADSVSQVLTLTGDGANSQYTAQINAIQLRDLGVSSTSVPEPSTYMMLGLGSLGLFLINRRRISQVAK